MIWLVQVVFDCADPDAIMQFWGQALDLAEFGVDNLKEEVDSLEVVAFVDWAESDFGVRFPEDMLNSCRTWADLVSVVESDQ